MTCFYAKNVKITRNFLKMTTMRKIQTVLMMSTMKRTCFTIRRANIENGELYKKMAFSAYTPVCKIYTSYEF